MKGESRNDWKDLWDEGRVLARAGDFSAAEKKYEELLFIKGNIEEARWELGRLFLRTGRWGKAADIFEFLVEAAPDRVDYLNGLGLALRKLGHFGRALDLFKKAHEIEAGDLTALAGLTQGLVEVGRKKEALPLLEEILARRPADRGIRRSLANLAFELGKLESARKFLLPLLKTGKADLDTLLMMARIYEGLNLEKAATRYWQRSLKHDQGNREALGRLAIYYEKNGRLALALPHLLALLEGDPQNISLLSRICRIYVQSDRFNEALPYFERYVELQPNDPSVLKPIINSRVDLGADTISLYRRLLAVTPDDLDLLDQLTDDLLATGDMEVALFMWEYVARRHPEKVEVYQEIVELLERLGRDERLAESLEILHKLAPGEIKVVSKLAHLKAAKGDLRAALEYYNKLEKAGYQGVDLYEGRGGLHEELGNNAQALSDYTKLLGLRPARDDIRRRAIFLAGELGRSKLLPRLVKELESSHDIASRANDTLLAARAFGRAGDFNNAFFRYQRILVFRGGVAGGRAAVKAPDDLFIQAKLGLAELYRAEGMIFEAEQSLRETFLLGVALDRVLVELFDLSLTYNTHGGEDAGVWLNKYEAVNSSSGDVVVMHARLLAAAGKYDKTENLLRHLLYETVAGSESSVVRAKKTALTRRAGLLLIEILISSSELAKAEQQCLAMLGAGRDPEVLVLLQKIYELDERAGVAKNISSQLINGARDDSELLVLARMFGKYGLLASQIMTAEKVLLSNPGSLPAGFILAEALVARGSGGDPLKLLTRMAELYPDNTSIIFAMARYYHGAGQYASALQHSNRFLERNPGRLDAQHLKLKCITALGEYDHAKDLVSQLFPERTATLLEKSIIEAGLKLDLPQPQRTFLQALTFSSGSAPSVAEELMRARYLADNSTDEQRERNTLAVPFYSRYRWEQEFRKTVADR